VSQSFTVLDANYVAEPQTPTVLPDERESEPSEKRRRLLPRLSDISFATTDVGEDSLPLLGDVRNVTPQSMGVESQSQ
jgi:hypothetical protein